MMHGSSEMAAVLQVTAFQTLMSTYYRRSFKSLSMGAPVLQLLDVQVMIAAQVLKDGFVARHHSLSAGCGDHM